MRTRHFAALLLMAIAACGREGDVTVTPRPTEPREAPAAVSRGTVPELDCDPETIASWTSSRGTGKGAATMEDAAKDYADRDVRAYDDIVWEQRKYLMVRYRGEYIALLNPNGSPNNGYYIESGAICSEDMAPER